MDSRRSIAFVVAHPDDVAFSFGGTAWLLHEQYKLHVLCASKGERGYAWKGQGMAPPSAEVAAQDFPQLRVDVVDTQTVAGNLASLVLLALSGYDSADDLNCSLRAGFDHHLVKPVDPEHLERLISQGVRAA